MNSALELIEDIRNGRMVILVDDEDRENEGDIVLAADFVTPELVNFMAKEARGLICLALNPEQIERLGLPPMVGPRNNHSPNKTAFTVSIEAASGVSTGISAADRAHTIRVASNPSAESEDVIMPGHVFPIRAQKGGVLKRAGHTEGSVDLARLAGLNPAAVICEIMKEDGTMARLPDLKEFAQKFNLKIGTIEDLIRHRLETETLVRQVADEVLPNHFPRIFESKFLNPLWMSPRISSFKKDKSKKIVPTLVRVQVENVLGDVFPWGRV
jgi:3,4-dihydroxy 2-butanone 4-phosphate synthase / GTP cyclohydrolase II